MKHIQVFDPALCCSSGVCGINVDEALVTWRIAPARVRNELSEIEAVAHQHSQRYTVVPLLKEEPVGIESLHQLASKEGISNREE